MIYIYALINPLTDCVFYIGATMHPEKRLINHCSCYWGNFKGVIIHEILCAGKKPEMLILEETDYDRAAFFEDFYLDLFRSYGFTIKQDRSNYKGNLLSKFQQKSLLNSKPN